MTRREILRTVVPLNLNIPRPHKPSEKISRAQMHARLFIGALNTPVGFRLTPMTSTFRRTEGNFMRNNSRNVSGVVKPSKIKSKSVLEVVSKLKIIFRYFWSLILLK